MRCARDTEPSRLLEVSPTSSEILILFLCESQWPPRGFPTLYPVKCHWIWDQIWPQRVQIRQISWKFSSLLPQTTEKMATQAQREWKFGGERAPGVQNSQTSPKIPRKNRAVTPLQGSSWAKNYQNRQEMTYTRDDTYKPTLLNAHESR